MFAFLILPPIISVAMYFLTLWGYKPMPSISPIVAGTYQNGYSENLDWWKSEFVKSCENSRYERENNSSRRTEFHCMFPKDSEYPPYTKPMIHISFLPFYFGLLAIAASIIVWRQELRWKRLNFKICIATLLLLPTLYSICYFIVSFFGYWPIFFYDHGWGMYIDQLEWVETYPGAIDGHYRNVIEFRMNTLFLPFYHGLMAISSALMLYRVRTDNKQ